jgi:hypothetical protein
MDLRAALLVLLAATGAACRREEPARAAAPAGESVPAGNAPANNLPASVPGAAPGGGASVLGAPTTPPGVLFTSYPPQTGTCTANTDCELVGALRTAPGLTGCCIECNSYVAGTHAWAGLARAACSAAAQCSHAEACPQVTVIPFVAACDSGHCVVSRNPAVWR